MKTVRAALLIVLLTILGLSPSPAAAADCKAEYATVLTAMRSGGPMRRVDIVTKNGSVVAKMVVDVSPPDQMKRVSEQVGYGSFTSLISGTKAWTFSTKNGHDEPARAENAAFAESELKTAFGLEDTNAPLVDCPTDANGTQTFTWKGEDGDKSVLNVATVDAKTHVVKALNRSTLDKRDFTKYERKSTYAAIPAFTVSAPAP